MFGTEIVSTVIYQQLTGLPEASSYAGKIIGASVIPQNMTLPAVTFAPQFSSYDSPIGAHQPGGITYEQLRFAITVMCAGLSTDPIVALAQAQLDHFDGSSFPITYGGKNYAVTFLAQGEVPLTTVADGANVYRQLGTVYTVDVTTGG